MRRSVLDERYWWRSALHWLVRRARQSKFCQVDIYTTSSQDIENLLPQVALHSNPDSRLNHHICTTQLAHEYSCTNSEVRNRLCVQTLMQPTGRRCTSDWYHKSLTWVPPASQMLECCRPATVTASVLCVPTQPRAGGVATFPVMPSFLQPPWGAEAAPCLRGAWQRCRRQVLGIPGGLLWLAYLVLGCHRTAPT